MANMPAEEVCKWIEHLRTRSGEQIVRLRKPWHSDCPSVQGVWHPFLNKHPSLGATSFPAPDLYHAKTDSASATEMVLQEAGAKKVGSVDDVRSKE